MSFFGEYLHKKKYIFIDTDFNLFIVASSDSKLVKH